MKKTLLILTSLVFLAGCQASSHNTGNITNGESSAGYSQDSGTSKELPKDRANANAEDVAVNVIGGVVFGGLIILLVLLLGVTIKEVAESANE